MTTLVIRSTDSRHAKAILLAADAGQWLRPDRPIAGRRAVGIPSQRTRGLYHWTDGETCSCYDFRRRQLPCKHVIAHKLDAIARRTQPQPASVVVEGLEQMARDRQLAADYDRILGEPEERFWARFDDDPRPARMHGVIPASQIVRED